MCNTYNMIKIGTEAYKIIQQSPNPKMAEKDYLECLILDTLFNNPYFLDNFVFAGGGSITKSYTFCRRIGQDIDLACADFEDIPDNRSGKQLQKFKKGFRTFVFDVLAPKINYIINTDSQFKIVTDRDWRALVNNEQYLASPTLHLLYTSKFGLDIGRLDIEIIPRVYKPDIITYRSVVPYSINQKIGDIPTVRYEQTFWDKVYALHSNAIADRPHTTHCFSRHYYDVAKLAPHVRLSETQDMLFDIEHHQQKYTSKNITPLGTTHNVQLLPENITANKLAQDYAGISSECSAPMETWTEIVSRLKQLNQNLKTL